MIINYYHYCCRRSTTWSRCFLRTGMTWSLGWRKMTACLRPFSSKWIVPRSSSGASWFGSWRRSCTTYTSKWMVPRSSSGASWFGSWRRSCTTYTSLCQCARSSACMRLICQADSDQYFYMLKRVYARSCTITWKDGSSHTQARARTQVCTSVHLVFTPMYKHAQACVHQSASASFYIIPTLPLVPVTSPSTVFFMVFMNA